MLFCLYQIMTTMGQTGTEAQTVVLTQELNQPCTQGFFWGMSAHHPGRRLIQGSRGASAGRYFHVPNARTATTGGSGNDRALYAVSSFALFALMQQAF
jgi:hypothetical protein